MARHQRARTQPGDGNVDAVPMNDGTRFARRWFMLSQLPLRSAAWLLPSVLLHRRSRKHLVGGRVSCSSVGGGGQLPCPQVALRCGHAWRRRLAAGTFPG